MKGLLLAGALALVASTAAQAQYGTNPQTHTTQGYTRNNGTVVQPYVATNPNGTQRDNFGATGNFNPNNGTIGTRNPTR